VSTGPLRGLPWLGWGNYTCLHVTAAFAAIALTFAAATGNRAGAIGLAVGLTVVMYLVDALASVVDGLGVVRPLSLFHYTWAAIRCATASASRMPAYSRRCR
jgi:hypothetical protein